MRKTFTALGLTAGLAAGSIAGLTLTGTTGLAGAQADTTTTSAPDTVDQNRAGRPDPTIRLREVLAPLVSDGTLTQVQADKVLLALEAAGPPAGGHGGHGGRGGRHGGPGLDAAAVALDMTGDELRSELIAGTSIAEVASGRDVDVDVVIAAMVKAHDEHLAEDVAAGRLTQAEADQRSADAETRITAMVNGEVPER